MRTPGHAWSVQASSVLPTRLAEAQVLDFDSLYESTVDAAYRVLQGLGVREAEIDDALQDVYVVAHRRLASFRGESKYSTWIAAIAVRVAHDYRRRHARKPSEPIEPHLDALLSDSPGAEARLIKSETLQSLENFLEQLSDAQREVFVLVELELESIPDIAQTLNVPLNTMYSRLRLARAQFERWVAENHGDCR